MKDIFNILKGKFRFSLIKVLYIYVSVNVCMKIYESSFYCFNRCTFSIKEQLAKAFGLCPRTLKT